MRCAAAPWGRLAAAGALIFLCNGCTPAPPPAREYELEGQILAVNLRTAVVGPDGRLVSIYDSNAWTATQVAGDLRTALAAR